MQYKPSYGIVEARLDISIPLGHDRINKSDLKEVIPEGSYRHP